MKRFQLIAFTVFGLALLTGCGTPTTVVGDKPEDKLNPAMPAHEREVRLHGPKKPTQPTAP